jgi:hypothetical protein
MLGVTSLCIQLLSCVPQRREVGLRFAPRPAADHESLPRDRQLIDVLPSP